MHQSRTSTACMCACALVAVAALLLGPAYLAAQDTPPRAWQAQLRPGVKAGAHLTRMYLDAFVPVWARDDQLVFVNPRLLLSDQHTNEGNVGIGYRRMLSGERWIVGGNLYYDERESEHGNPFHQLGLGFEALSRWLDVRANYYHPLTKAQRVSSLDSGAFTETSLLRFPGYEEALQGVDYEAMVLVPRLSELVETRIGLGGFYYDAERAKSVDGHRIRLEVRPNALLTLEAEWRDIHAADNDYFVGGYVSLPFDVGALVQGRNPFHGARDALRLGQGTRPLRARMTDAVVRDVDITSQAKPDTLHPEQEADVVFVDNSYTGTRSGTRSQPHNTLAQAVADSDYGAGVWIFVEKGSGNYTSIGVNLANNSTLWGDGYRFLGLGGDGHPVLAGNGVANILFVGSGNTIQGVQVQGGPTGISATASTTSPGTIVIRNNILTSMTGNAISFVPTGGTHDITVHSNTITSNIADGVNLVPTGGTFTVAIQRNTITSNSSDGIEISPTSGTHTVTIQDNTITSNSSDGIRITPTGGTHTITIQRNTINSNSDEAIDLVSTAGTYTTLIEGNTANSSGDQGIVIGAEGTSTMTATIRSNTVTSSASNNIDTYADNTGTMTVTLIGNTATGGINGILSRALTSATTTATLKDNIVTSSSQTAGLALFATGTATITGLFEHNTATGNPSGIVLLNQGTGTMTADVGGGALGSAGRNRLFSNTTSNISNSSGTNNVKAENNWFGSATASPGTAGANTFDTTPQATTDPGP